MAQAIPARSLSTAESHVAVWVIPTNEELMLARHTLTMLQVPDW